MQGDIKKEPMMEMFLFELSEQIEQLEQIMLKSEEMGCFDRYSIDEIFRLMHTIKGSAAMMMQDNMSMLAHSIEDLFDFIRNNEEIDMHEFEIIEIVLESIDFIKGELNKLLEGRMSDGEASNIIKRVEKFLRTLGYDVKTRKLFEPEKSNRFYVGYSRKNSGLEYKYKVFVKFKEGSEMENIRAFGIIHSLRESIYDVIYKPEDILTNSETANFIRENGFLVYFKSELDYDKIEKLVNNAAFLSKVDIEELTGTDDGKIFDQEIGKNDFTEEVINKDKGTLDAGENINNIINKASMISVNVNKLDVLMDLVGELVISGQMITQNPDVVNANHTGFKKQAKIHTKLISELQDITMSLRMVPLSSTFNKMKRIIRDVSKKLNKSVKPVIIGEETEIDKNIVEKISDPLMHIVRNAVDHGIEDKEQRIKAGKNEMATVSLEAKNVGGEVWIIIKDDGKGIDLEKIYEKALKKGLVTKEFNNMSNSELYSLMFKPGFSTSEIITEFSGRGVGLDVVQRKIEEIGGSTVINSIPGKGSTFIIKIPLTLAIIGGIIIKVGNNKYALPTMSVRESFRANKKDIIADSNAHEMIMVRGECYPVIRIHKMFDVKTRITDFTKGITIMVENEHRKYCIFADELLEEQQVVVKPLPNYIIRRIKGVSGCTLLRDGSISLIIDLESLVA